MVAWGDGRVYGACGGNSDVTSPEIAEAKSAMVQFHKCIPYRHDLLGFRSLAQFLDQE